MRPGNESVLPSERVFIGLGANLGDREAGIRKALKMLAEQENVRVPAVSRIYESAAMTREGDDPHPSYLNAVAEIVTTLSPEELLDLLLDIERTLGRIRGPGARWQSRSIDLDILLIGDRVINTESLSVPHPGIAHRAFVLRPLAELAANHVVPTEKGLTVQELLNRHEGSPAHPFATYHSIQTDHGE